MSLKSKQLEGLQNQAENLIKSINKLREASAIASDAEMKFSYDQRIALKEKELEDLKKQIAQLESEKETTLIIGSLKNSKSRLIWLGGIVVATITFLAAIAELSGYSLRDIFTVNKEKKIELPTPKLTSPCGFPTEFKGDSLYILVTRFEDYISRNDAECFGLALMRRIDAKNLPIKICYREELTPRIRADAKRYQEQYNADLVLWGNVKDLAESCSAGDICFRSQPSDTLIKICGGQVKSEKADLEYENDLRPEDIEQGALNIGAETFDAWLSAIFNAKIGKKKPDFFIVDESLPKLKQAELWYEKGNLFLNIGNLSQGTQCYTQAILLNPNDATFYNALGDIKYYLKAFRDAISYYDIAIRLDANYTIAYINRGVAKRGLRDYQRAVEDFDQAIQLDHNNSSAYFQRGVVKGSYLKDDQGAIADYNKAIELDPNFASAYNNRGSAKRSLKDDQGAIADYNKSIELDPNYATPYYNRGYAKSELKDDQGAIADYNKAIELNPNNAFAYHNRGNAKRGLKDDQGAIVDYNKAIELNPNYATAYNNRGNAKSDLKDYLGAMADYTKAIELDPNYATAYYNRGNAKSDLKDYPGAMADYTKAIELDPNFATAYYNRGGAKRDLKDYQGALTDYTKAIELDPNFATAYINRGYAKSELKDDQGAIADYNKAIELNPNFATAYINRGLLYQKIGEKQKAELDFKKASTLDSSFRKQNFYKIIRIVIWIVCGIWSIDIFLLKNRIGNYLKKQIINLKNKVFRSTNRNPTPDT